jgi:hypothetical protein
MSPIWRLEHSLTVQQCACAPALLDGKWSHIDRAEIAVLEEGPQRTTAAGDLPVALHACEA